MSDKESKFLVPAQPKGSRLQISHSSSLGGSSSDSDPLNESSFRSNDSFVSPTIPNPPQRHKQMAYFYKEHEPVIKSSFKSPAPTVFNELRPILLRFRDLHKDKLRLLKSYVLTIGNVDNVDCILLLAEDSSQFKFNSEFHEKNRVVIRENSVTFAVGPSSLYQQYLSIGNEISSIGSDSYGTLGGFVESENEIFGLTAYHVINNGASFLQPSQESVNSIIETSRTAEKKNKDKYLAGFAANFGSGRVIVEDDSQDCSWLDYQLLKLTRNVEKPLNRLQDNDRALKTTLVDLNTNSNEFKTNKVVFAKKGATTGVTIGYIHNHLKRDCFIKVKDALQIPNICLDKDGDVQTIEFAFIQKNGAEKRFADNGDSGAIVYVHEDNANPDNKDQVIGMVFAVTNTDPFLTFVTPIQNILKDLKDKHNKTINFPI